MFYYLQNYFLFILVIFLIYYSVSYRIRPYVLLVSGLCFIAAISVMFAIFALAFTLMNFLFGKLLYHYLNDPVKRPRIFWMIIITDIGLLSFFKYSVLFTSVFNILSAWSQLQLKIPYSNIIVPLGMSYYTFQVLGYIIRINRRSEIAENDFGLFASYLLFFPKFLSGPVERSNHFFPQLKKNVPFDRENIYAGSRLFLWGLFKKAVIADSLYGPLFRVYDDIHSYSGLPLIIVLLFQTIYIYNDFSGYTDMALGSAKIFGIDLVDNFNRPFLARSISEYWRRWHISLSSWCNDFIYNPFIVKYRRFGGAAAIPGIFITFFIVGIWHGANWTFVVLGVLQAFAILYENYTKRVRIKITSGIPVKLVNTLSRIIVFLFMSFSMIFFFSNSIADAWYFVTHLFANVHFNKSELAFISYKPEFIFSLGFFTLFFIFEMGIEKGNDIRLFFFQQSPWLKWMVYLVGILLIYHFNHTLGTSPFYYSRF